MPIYEYECTSCHVRQDIYHGYHENKKYFCQICKVPMIKTISVPMFIGSSEPRTVGGLADKNADKFSDEYKRELLLKNRKREKVLHKHLPSNMSIRKPKDE